MFTIVACLRTPITDRMQDDAAAYDEHGADAPFPIPAIVREALLEPINEASAA